MRKFFRIDGSEIENPSLCSFGILEVALPAAITAGLTSLGVGAATAGIGGTLGAGALVGAGIGAATDWKQPLKGAEFGALAGLGAAGGPLLGGALGIGATAGGALSGAAGGALGGAATGRNIGTSALMGGAGGALVGALSPGATGTGTPATGAGASAAGAAAPGSVAGAGADLTSTAGVPSAVGANLPGSVGAGAATGVPSAATGIESVNVTPMAQIGGAGAPAAAAPVAAALPTSGGDFASQVLAAPAGDAAAAAPATIGTAATNAGEAANVIGDSATIGATPAASASGPMSLGSMLKSPQGLMSVGGLGLNMLMGNQKPAGFSQMQSEAGALTRQGGQLQSYLTSGQLPQGLQANLDQAANAARASVRSQYANSGMAGSSAEAQDVANVGEREVAQGAQIAESLFQQGFSETQLGSQLYMQLMGIQMEQDKQLSESVGNFVTSFANMGRPSTAQTYSLTPTPAGG